MENTLWLLIAYLLGILSGSALLITMAFWNDFKKWADDLVWKFKLRRFR